MTIPIFYDARMSVDTTSYSQSASKPKRFVELMAHYDFRGYGPDSLGPVSPITKDDLYLVHKKDHVDSIFSLRAPNGFENCDPLLPDSTLWTIGSLLSASRYAMQHPAAPVCSPTSGFHHSGYSIGSGGFCTFNGLMVVAARLINETPGFKVAVLDLDAHEGNGSVDILKHFPKLAKQVLHLSSGAHFCGDNPKQEALEFQAWLHEAIKDINHFKPDLVLYQAGADAWIKDALGSGYLAQEELRQRDQDVFDGVLAPIVWNLAGGYTKTPATTIFNDPVLAIHRATLNAADFSVKTRIQKGLKP
jgi:acetoin utilization deacetylase AcuC-like enzyme